MSVPKEIELNDGQKMQFPVEPSGMFAKIKNEDGVQLRIPVQLGEIETKCVACNGFGYTKGGPDGPWEKVDCEGCKGKGRTFRPHQYVIESDDPVIESEAGPTKLSEDGKYTPTKHVQAMINMQALHGLEGLVGDARAAQYLGEEIIRALRKQ